jgi:hypothetical protein
VEEGARTAGAKLFSRLIPAIQPGSGSSGPKPAGRACDSSPQSNPSLLQPNRMSAAVSSANPADSSTSSAANIGKQDRGFLTRPRRQVTTPPTTASGVRGGAGGRRCVVRSGPPGKAWVAPVCASAQTRQVTVRTLRMRVDVCPSTTKLNAPSCRAPHGSSARLPGPERGAHACR